MTDPKTMTDAELNAECAKLVGWQEIKVPSYPSFWEDPSGKIYGHPPPCFSTDRNAIAEWLWPELEKSALHIGQFLIYLRKHAEGRMTERPLSAGHEFNGWQWYMHTDPPRVQAEAFVEVMRTKP